MISMEVSVTKAINDQLVFNKRYKVLTPIAEKSIGSMIESFSTGFNQLFMDLSRDLNSKFGR